MEPPGIVDRTYAIIFRLLAEYPDGLRWSELLRKIAAADPTLHPKTVNGCIWKLVARYPDRVYKPAKGLFRLTEFRTDDE